VSVVIAPWNFPLAILCGMTVAALVCGNPVIIKPAEQSSGVAKWFFDVLLEAGVDAGVVHFLPGLGEVVGAHLVKSPHVHIISFTGSRSVGLSIMREATTMAPGQRHIKKVIAEMGGKNAVIIDDDADLDEAVVGCLQSAFGFAGQKCSALSRIIIVKEIYGRFKKRFLDAFTSLAVGPAEGVSHKIGPVIDEETQERLLVVIKKYRKDIVAQIELTPELMRQGFFVPPTVFASTDFKSDLGQQEFFGPLVTLFQVECLDEAIQAANDVDYALTGGIFSRSPAHIEKIKRELEVGNLYINRGITGALVNRQPFGGFKLSGVGGKAGGPDYLRHFVEARSITENTMRRGFAPEVVPH
jgi:RHH-type proline utilization regulon transcriptional repressor/proline dehydrogenase/delta 1-pyrroline-5-carboxylate dehydrogenase